MKSHNKVLKIQSLFLNKDTYWRISNLIGSHWRRKIGSFDRFLLLAVEILSNWGLSDVSKILLNWFVIDIFVRFFDNKFRIIILCFILTPSLL